MKKRLFFLLFVFFGEIFAVLDAVPTSAPIDQAAANPALTSNTGEKGEPTDGELGIIGSLAGAYNKTREAVKSVYDEIQYWKGIGATYDMLKDWYKDQKEKYKAIRRTVAKLSHNPKEVFSNTGGKDWFETMLNNLEAPLEYTQYYTGTATNLVNQTDDFAYSGMRNLDKIFSHTETYVTKLGDSKISGMLMPNTDEIYDKFDEIIYTSPNISEEWKQRIIDEDNYQRFKDGKFEPLSLSEEQARKEAKQKAMEKFFTQNSALFSAAQIEDFPETKIVNTIKGLTASATGNSAMYYQWAIQSMENLSERIDVIDQKFKAGEMDNIIDLQILAAKLESEMINANNKRLLHELEALKIHHAMLGYEIWKHSRVRAFDETAIADILDLRQIAYDRLQNLKARNQKEHGDSTYGSEKHRGIFSKGKI